MRNRYRVALVALVVSLPLLMAPSGGFPSRPRFAKIGIGMPASGAANQAISMAATDPYIAFFNPTGLTRTAYVQSLTAGNVEFQNEVSGGHLNLRTTGAGVVQANGVAIATSESGTFAATLTTGCATTPSLNFRWARSGNVVTIASTGTTTCTSNSVTTALTAAIPAAIRPAANQCVAYIMATDNGAGTNAAVQIQTDGDINFAEGLGSNCNSLGWTSSGTKTLNEWNGSYVLN